MATGMWLTGCSVWCTLTVPPNPTNAAPSLTTTLSVCVWSSWVEEDPKEIMQSVYECMERTCEKLQQLNIDLSNIKGVDDSVSSTRVCSCTSFS